MDSYFTVEICRGPFKNLTEDYIIKSIEHTFEKSNIDLLGEFWENFSFAEDVLERATVGLSEDSIMNQDASWLVTCKNAIIQEVFLAAKEIYLNDRKDATWRIISGDSWILSGGITWDGDSTEAAEYIKMIRWSGLDEYLYLNPVTSTNN